MCNLNVKLRSMLIIQSLEFIQQIKRDAKKAVWLFLF